MKTAIPATLLALLCAAGMHASGQAPSLIHYQGRITSGTNLVNGNIPLALRLYDAPAAGTLLYEDSNVVAVVDGLYSTAIGDGTVFGSLGTAVQSTQVWLEVVANGSVLSPRERVASVAYALVADGVRPGGISMTMIADGATLAEIADDDGSGSGLDADLLDGMQSSAFATGSPVYVESDTASWRLAGNAGTSPGTQFLGSTDMVPFEMRVNNERVARFEPSTNSAGVVLPNVVLGHASNFTMTGLAFGATIGGGGTPTQPNRVESLFDTVAGGAGNRAAGGESTVSGGRRNTAAAYRSVVSGGFSNLIRSGSAQSVIGGGLENTIEADSTNGVIGGGWANRIESNTVSAAIGGGAGNLIDEGSRASVVGGGEYNSVRYFSSWTTIGGGFSNEVFNSEFATIDGGSRNRIDTNSTGAVIGGGSLNAIQAYADHSVIGGGQENFIGDFSSENAIAGGRGQRIERNSDKGFIGGGSDNVIQSLSDFSVIAGGSGHVITSNSPEVVIGGGRGHSVGRFSQNSGIFAGESHAIGIESRWTFIGGGYDNAIGSTSQFATISGGFNSRIGNNAGDAVIGGGRNNTVNDIASGATISGGEDNSVSQGASHAAIGGGRSNIAGGSGSVVPGGFYCDAANTLTFAAGNRAKAGNAGAFVWADSQDFDFASTATDQFNIRAVGGARIVSGIDGTGSVTSGVQLAAGAGAWTSLSDVNAKENFSDVDVHRVLERVAAMPVREWNYKTQDDSIRHIGPTAQDFRSAFGVGESETGITTIDADGIAFAAIQALRLENEDLKQRLAALEARVNETNP